MLVHKLLSADSQTIECKFTNCQLQIHRLSGADPASGAFRFSALRTLSLGRGGVGENGTVALSEALRRGDGRSVPLPTTSRLALCICARSAASIYSSAMHVDDPRRV